MSHRLEIKLSNFMFTDYVKHSVVYKMVIENLSVCVCRKIKRKLKHRTWKVKDRMWTYLIWITQVPQNLWNTIEREFQMSSLLTQWGDKKFKKVEKNSINDSDKIKDIKDEKNISFTKWKQEFWTYSTRDRDY